MNNFILYSKFFEKGNKKEKNDSKKQRGKSYYYKLIIKNKMNVLNGVIKMRSRTIKSMR